MNISSEPLEDMHIKIDKKLSFLPIKTDIFSNASQFSAFDNTEWSERNDTITSFENKNLAMTLNASIK